MKDLAKDLRFGLRMLLRHPTVTVISLLTLGLGIGASTAVFSVVDATLLSPPPFEEPDRLVRLFASKPAAGWDRMTISVPNFRDWSEQSSSFEATGIFGYEAVNVRGEEHPDRFRAIRASSGVLRAPSGPTDPRREPTTPPTIIPTQPASFCCRIRCGASVSPPNPMSSAA